jgi:uncharacterized protein (DUF58 family)
MVQPASSDPQATPVTDATAPRTPRVTVLARAARPALQRAVRVLRDGFPLTARGVGVVGAAAACLRWYGFRDLDGVWYVAGIGLLAIAALSALLMLGAFVRLWLALRAPAERTGNIATDTELAVPSGFSLPSLRFVPLVELRSSVVPAAGAEVSLVPSGPALREQLAFHDHAEVRALTRRIEVRDVLGLTALALRRSGRVEIDVLPHLGAFRGMPLLFSLSGGDDVPHPLGVEQGDRLELKRYAPGDPARFIHWKVYARTGKLVVRMPERALSRAYRVAAYLCAGELDGASAAAARAALSHGALGADFRFGADGAQAAARDVAAALPLVRRSSAARRAPGAGLSAFVAEVEREGPCSLVLFVPPVSDAALARVRDLLRAHRRPVRVVIGVDGIAEGAARSWARRVLFATRPGRAVEREALALSVQAYRKLGCDVLVLDRVSGRVLGDAHFARPRAAVEERAA